MMFENVGKDKVEVIGQHVQIRLLFMEQFNNLAMKT